jgi:protein-S-isoprenylcysteine O-methyltransferase Ste14
MQFKGPKMKTEKESIGELPRLVYLLLFFILWALMTGAVIALYLRWTLLDAWKIFLYAGLLSVYLWAERRAYQEPDQPGERVHRGLRYALFLSWSILMGGALLEYALWPHAQIGFTIAGALLALAGTSLRVWSIRSLGRYFSGHTEAFEGQRVIETGPYRWIRHPGYAGNILHIVGMPLVVNAYPTLALSALVAALFVRRVLWEEEFLAQEIVGYRDYMRRTDRLIPGVW